MFAKAILAVTMEKRPKSDTNSEEFMSSSVQNARVSPRLKVHSLCPQVSQKLIINNMVTVFPQLRDLGLGFNRKIDTLSVPISTLEQTGLLSGSELPQKFWRWEQVCSMRLFCLWSQIPDLSTELTWKIIQFKKKKRHDCLWVLIKNLFVE